MANVEQSRNPAELDSLKKKISEIEKRFAGKNLNEVLEPRKLAELEFHNQHRDETVVKNLPQDTFELLHGNKKYYSTTQISQEYIDKWIRTHVPGKVVLDYACGNGGKSLASAREGAALTIGLDISDVSVKNCRRFAERDGFSDRCVFMQGDCENTGLPDNSIDVILCFGMLHHLDLNFAFPELERILRPGGVVFAVEALDYNPLIKAYRLLTPSMRTDWEKNHILSLKDLKLASKYFDVGEVRYFHLLSPLAALISRKANVMGPVLNAFNAIDKVLTKTPLVKLLSWQFTFELHKKKSRS